MQLTGGKHGGGVGGKCITSLPPSLSNVAVAVAAAKVQQGKFTYDQMMQQGMKEDALK